jgi:hypothetical protein
MLNLDSEPTDVPPVYTAPAGTSLAGRVYIVKNEDGTPVPQLRDGRQAVLLCNGGQLELVTCAEASGMIREGTYLDEADVGRLTSLANPRLRLYGWRDTWGKMWSGQGAVLLLTTLLGLLAAAAGLYFVAWGETPLSPASVADRARVGIEWTVEPADRFHVARARRELHRRQVQTTRCLDQLAGRPVPEAHVPGVSCEASSPPWYRSTDSAAGVTVVVGFLTALLAALGLRSQFGFQRSPG